MILVNGQCWSCMKRPVFSTHSSAVLASARQSPSPAWSGHWMSRDHATNCFVSRSKAPSDMSRSIAFPNPRLWLNAASKDDQACSDSRSYLMYSSVVVCSPSIPGRYSCR